MDHARFIDTPEALEALCRELEACSWLALDTEFIREKTYYPQLCLIQVATPDLVACIDPLALEDLAPLDRLLRRPDLLKVLHAAGQDLEIFYHRDGTVPAPIFDTQVAASLLGHGDQIGYGKLIQAVLQVELEKGHSRTDWARRPLDPEQLAYAADDVRYLAQAYPLIHDGLERSGRLPWLEEDFARLADPASYEPAPDTMWRRLKGINTLRGIQLAIARELARWREQEAMRADRPRRWLLQDEVILDLARRKPSTPANLERIRGLQEQTLRRHGQTLLDLVRTGLSCPQEAWPVLPPRIQLSPAQEALADVAMGLLRHQAQQNDISPAAIATRKDVESLVAGNADCPLLKGWRARLAGKTLQQWLQGERAMRVKSGQLHLD
ncbi:ribonuclease D [Ectothiorhodospira shaposhnikovii]|uniref:ribonuclease D n=1 Tax=Ectothiorhodospira shaposhnikovii TaxID=1054 RepID=UPI00190688A5|nr:ribonuclease D [Ectothiorhodospira shaposhnikovii]MBK1673694.1 ribonuclease D [Ectothiorhodospira shaposhnikovii]